MKKLNKKIFSVFLMLIMFYNLFYPLLNVGALEDDESYIARTISDVNVRSLPTTDKNPDGSNNKIGEFDEGVLITVLNKEVISGNGCSAGWLKVTDGQMTGYVCAKYIIDATNDSIDRPWTTPKKAIIGGAKFISKSYISKGQFTSYLKKFNVNPDAYYSVYTHQYMANLQAPSSESASAYKTYSENELLEMPLVFSIPVYLNMEEEYNRPGGNLATIEKLEEVEDEEFEKLLDEQEFPDSYKKILRVVHKNHDNWSFKAMHTNIDFKTAVLVEQSVSSVQGGNIYYDLSSGSAIQTEKGWYLANNETVSYYLDPRNFLTDKYILMFESLEYSEHFTEEVVQSVLKGSFMEEYSLIDNQSYASIFVEAGKESSVSPVYLASLARIESGAKGGLTTSGEEFIYEGVTYSGLFNFYNIGAYSSAANPAKAGLVYASGGYCTNCNPDSVPEIPIVDPGTSEEPKEEEKYDVNKAISDLGLILKDDYLVGFEVEMAAAKLKEKDSTLKISQDIIGTGSVIEFQDGSKFTVVIYGDNTGDGKINSADLLKLRKHLLNTEPLSGAYLKSTELTGDGKINSADLLKLRQYLLGTASINQK